jgi:putative ABC transport system ATP-binding protein
LVIKPALLLADEPTGNLDMETGEKVSQLLFDLVDEEKKSLVLVTHNLVLANQCQTIRTLDRGRLV